MESENIKKEKKQKGTFKQLLEKMGEIYKPFIGVIVVILLFTFLQEGLNLVGPYVYGKIIDGIIGGESMAFLIKLCLIALGIFLLNDVVLGYWQYKIEIDKFDFDVPRTVARKTLEKIFNLSIGQHENQNSGVKKSVIDRGQNALTEISSELIYQIFPTVLQVLVTVTALFIVAPPLGGIVFVGVIAFVIISLYSNKVLGDDLKKVQDMYVESDKKQSEFLRNVSLVKVNAKESQAVEEYDSNYLSINNFGKQVWFKFIKFIRGRNFISDVTRIAVLVAGIYLVYNKVYTPGSLVIFLSWSTSAFDRINSLSYLHRRFTQLYAAIKSYFTLLAVESDVKEIDNPVIIEKIKGRVEYRGVFFKYPQREEIVEGEKGEIIRKKAKEENSGVLKNINIAIEAGQRVAIVGHSGAGKSTLVQLLIRAYDPDRGKILIDGHDLKDLSLEEYRRELGIVPQDVALFDNTLRYNILFGVNGEVSEKKLEEAVKMAQVGKFLKSLEGGLDTFIGERGVKLSGGERQRVGIARALIKDPSILIFDEATSSLDVENEALIREAIDKASKGRTTIIIAHRLSTIKDADKIIVLEGGHVVGEGKHKDLLKTCEPYRKMINIQTVIVGGN